MSDQFEVQINSNLNRGNNAVILPCTPDQFSQFIANLLGRAQELTGTRSGRFKIDKEGALQLHNLIVQRVYEQHGSHPLQVTARIDFDNETTILFNTIDDFSNFHEVRSVESVGLYLTWTFLVSFPGGAGPEKQEIEFNFNGGSFSRKVGRDQVVIGGDMPGKVGYLIRHTARTWGTDIEALLSHYIDSLMVAELPFRKLLRKHSSIVGLAVGLVVFILLFGGLGFTNASLMEQQSTFLMEVLGDAFTPTKKLDHIIAYLLSARDGVRSIYSTLFVIVGIVGSLVAGVYTGITASDHPPANVVLTKRSEEAFAIVQEKYRRSTRKLITSVIGAFVLAIMTNICYDFLVKGMIENAKTIVLLPSKPMTGPLKP